MGQFQYAPLDIMCIIFDWVIRLNDLIHAAGEGVISTIILCVHEQSLTGICIFHVFYLLPWITYVQIVN